MSRDPRVPTTPSMSTLEASATEDTADPPVRFEPGAILANRYRIVRFIAAGGMGEVYEAQDLELGEHVALKTLRTERAGGRAAEYFRREVLLARKVTHPNVCRLFDFERHEGTAFLTMELLPGQTLAEHIRELGRIPPEKALPIVRQLLAALGAAHDAGVIHRDFKSANVLLIGSRAKVTDFGLARPTESSAATDRGHLAGTLGYMAPEQVEAGPITPRTDLYALGVVMFEMVTGELPFDGPTPLLAATRRLTERAPSARQRVPELDRRWDAVIARCLERHPDKRFANAAEVLAALEDEAPPPRARTGALALALGLVIAAVAVGWVAVHRHRPPTTAVRARSAIAVLGFQNRSGRSDAGWLSSAFGEMLASELAAGDQLRLVAGEVVARAKRELAIADADGLAADTLHKLRDDVGADYVVLGSYLSVGDRVRLDVRLQDARSGETVLALGDEAAQSELFALVSRMGSALRRRLGGGQVSEAEAASVRAATPAGSEAARLYAVGLSRLQSFDALGAREKLEAAVRAEPSFPLAHAALAEALAQLGEDRHAAEEAKLALDHAQGLPRRDRLHVEARYDEATQDYARAAEIYRSLYTVFPDSLEDGLALARVLTEGGHAKDALAVVAELRRLPGADPRIDLAEADAAAGMNDFRHEQSAAAAAEARGRASGARLLLAQALLDDSWASRKLGQEARGLGAIDEARALYEAVGDRRGVALSRHHRANALEDRSDLKSALLEEEAALEMFRELGDRKGQHAALGTIGNILCDMGDLDGARRRYEAELAIVRALGDRRDEAGALLNIGIVLVREGKSAEARGAAEQALATFRELGNRYAEGIALLTLGAVARAEGDLGAARSRLEESLATFRAIGDRPDGAEAQEELGSLLRVMGDREAARKNLDEAIATCTELLSVKIGAIARRERARLLAAEGQRQDAIRDARAAADTLAKEGAADDEALARAVLGKLLGGKDGARELERARELAAHTQNATVRAEVLGR